MRWEELALFKCFSFPLLFKFDSLNHKSPVIFVLQLNRHKFKGFLSYPL